MYKELQGGFPSIKEKSDWELLEDALASPETALSKEIRILFSKSGVYRLRFVEHKKLGVEYVSRLLKKHSTYLSPFNGLWDVGVSQNQVLEFETLFHRLVRLVESDNVAGIYRLYDLCEGKRSESELHFSFEKFLSLLFAFGLKNGVSPESLSALVAKFQFFEHFSKMGKIFLKDFFGCRSSARDEAYLTRAETHDFVSNLWDGHLQAAEELSYGNSQLLLEDSRIRAISEQLASSPKVVLNDELRSVAQLRTVFSSPMQNRYRSSSGYQSPVGFRSNFEAAYHPFKHQDKVDFYFGRRLTTIFDYSFRSPADFREYTHRSMQDYMHMISEIIEGGKFVGAQPNQFDSGVTFKFKSESSDRAFGVIVSCYPVGYSYLLTCF